MMDQELLERIEYGFTWPEHSYDAPDGASFYVREDVSLRHIEPGMSVQIVCQAATIGNRFMVATVERGTVVDIDPDFGDIIIRRFGEPFNVRIHRERVVSVLPYTRTINTPNDAPEPFYGSDADPSASQYGDDH